MEEQIPKAIKVENVANILKVDFDNGQTKYLKSHWVEDLGDAFKLNSKGARKNLLGTTTNMWIGSKAEIQPDGTVVLNETDRYTAEELWHKGQDSIPKL
ncbi:hypothetical protein ACFFRT_05210 [Enterococcus thailandicus]|uniref:Uncharacterized protein n=1 Tax=Enterococcus thailandicus TaxID=417368 RepID=A0A510WCN5_ENTTH|nr:hypothetical protein [Enterococcus thailandicus]OJG95549.1 hypothetical protein RV17_GL001830 [Enterococcus thailandicus]GEK36952.1 hypothetical protein ETH01_12390 [Enterococcus thailandicus]